MTAPHIFEEHFFWSTPKRALRGTCDLHDSVANDAALLPSKVRSLPIRPKRGGIPGVAVPRRRGAIIIINGMLSFSLLLKLRDRLLARSGVDAVGQLLHDGVVSAVRGLRLHVKDAVHVVGQGGARGKVHGRRAHSVLRLVNKDRAEREAEKRHLPHFSIHNHRLQSSDDEISEERTPKLEEGFAAIF